MPVISGAIISSGTYTGDGATSARHIYTGFACKVVIVTSDNPETCIITRTVSSHADMYAVDGVFDAKVKLDGGDGFWVADGDDSCNNSGREFQWVAMGS